MRFIICGTMLDPIVEEILPGASPAAGKYLRNLKRSLELKGNEVIFCSYVAVPGAKDAYVKCGVDDNSIIYKDKTIIRSVRQYKKKVLNTAQKGDVVIFYNVLYFDMGLVNKLKKKGVKSLLILADHTGDMKENGNIIRGTLAKLIARDYLNFEYVIALSHKVCKFLNPNAHIEIMEGGIDLEKFEDFQPPRFSDVTRYMYAGTLSDVTGVDILLDAVRLVQDENCEFYISGKGTMEDVVKEAAKDDARIKYIGFIPDEDYYDQMKKMDVFVNPRNMNMEQNQNNFPSKVLEYLATGRAVISTRFIGWEKFTDCFEFCDHTAKSLSTAMSEARIKSQEDKDRLFEHNRKRAEQYSWNNQAAVIIGLVNAT